ncbi:MAG: hypothetical protein K8I82_26845, partial [Anaerolineae bacterium]|nr:hypothetical protein [Anaerolineae bacterium]
SDRPYRVGLYELLNPQTSFTELTDILEFAWQRDSSGFIASVHKESQNTTLDFFDRNGIFLERIFDLGAGQVNFSDTVSGRNDLQWSPDESRFALLYETYDPNPAHHLYIMDWQKKIIIDTCLNPVSKPIWSPDGKMLVYLALARENLKVIVVDLESWQAYDVARFSGIPAFWNVPEIIGWPSDDGE